MASFADDLYRALNAELKCAARRKGISLQDEFRQRCLAADNPTMWDDVVERSLISRERSEISAPNTAVNKRQDHRPHPPGHKSIEVLPENGRCS